MNVLSENYIYTFCTCTFEMKPNDYVYFEIIMATFGKHDVVETRAIDDAFQSTKR